MENHWPICLGTLNKKGLNEPKQFLKLCFREGLSFSRLLVSVENAKGNFSVFCFVDQ